MPSNSIDRIAAVPEGLYRSPEYPGSLTGGWIDTQMPNQGVPSRDRHELVSGPARESSSRRLMLP